MLKETAARILIGSFVSLMMLLPFVTLDYCLLAAGEDDLRMAEFYPCDALGYPEYHSARRTLAYFNVTLVNVGQELKNVCVCLAVQDELSVPIGYGQLNLTIAPNASTYCLISFFVPHWTYVGTATAYASVWADGTSNTTRSTQFWIEAQDVTPPAIRLLSPANLTYGTEHLPMIFTVNEAIDWACYSQNGQGNVTISGNTTLPSLANGQYRIVVYANDTSGNIGCSEDIHFTLLVIHDLTVVDLRCASMHVYRGRGVKISATVENKGNTAETFNVTAYAGSAYIGKLVITNLLPDNRKTIVFTWSTGGATYGNYTISAEADIVSGETNVTDNMLVDGTIKVTIPGDVDGDFKVASHDWALLAASYGSTPSSPRWNQDCDINGDDAVGPADFALLSAHFGEHYP